MIRMQDKDGRGPYKPNFTKYWCDEFGPAPPPTIMEEFGDKLAPAVAWAHKSGFHIGCAYINEKCIDRLLSQCERQRLKYLGYFLVDASACCVLLQSENQLLIVSKKPLKFLPKITE